MKGRRRKSGPSDARDEVLYGFHAVVEMLSAGRRAVRRIHLDDAADSRRSRGITEMAASRHIAVDRCSRTVLDKMAGSHHHQGVAARVGPFPMQTEKQLLRRVQEADACFLLMLDQVQDPHNLGALVRSAHCAGVDAVVITRHRSAGPTPVVSRVSAGALEHMAVVTATNLVSLVGRLKSAGVWIAGLDGGAERHLFTTDLTGSLALVIGGEQSGIRPLVKSHCDFHLAIPHVGDFNSLNASAAGAVAMFEVYRQRHYPDGDVAQPKRSFQMDLTGEEDR